MPHDGKRKKAVVQQSFSRAKLNSRRLWTTIKAVVLFFEGVWYTERRPVEVVAMIAVFRQDNMAFLPKKFLLIPWLILLLGRYYYSETSVLTLSVSIFAPVFLCGRLVFFCGPQSNYVGAVLRPISAHPSTGLVNRNGGTWPTPPWTRIRSAMHYSR